MDRRSIRCPEKESITETKRASTILSLNPYANNHQFQQTIEEQQTIGIPTNHYTHAKSSSCL